MAVRRGRRACSRSTGSTRCCSRRRLCAARLLAAADRRAGGLAVGAGRRVGARRWRPPGARTPPSSPRCSRCSSRRASSLARLLRIGWVADYLSRPVLVGYIHGVAVVLVIGQLGKLLGISIDGHASRSPQLAEVVRELGDVERRDGRASARSRSSCCSRLRFVAPKVPASLVVVVAGDRRPRRRSTSRAHGVAVVGDAARPASRARSSRRRRWTTWSRSLPAAVGLFLVSFADEVLTARSFAGRHDQHIARRLRSCVAMGAANAVAGRHAGPAGRRQRLAHRGQRRDGRAQPDLRASSRPSPSCSCCCS